MCIDDRAADAVMGALFGELGASDHFCRSMATLGAQVRKAAVSRFGRLSLTWTGGRRLRQEQEATAIADDPGKGDPVAQKMRRWLSGWLRKSGLSKLLARGC
jgi:hypothetical protein